MPLARADWLLIDDAYQAQMRERAQLLASRQADVVAILPQAVAAAAELLDIVLGDLPGLGFDISSQSVTRPDGVQVTIDKHDPLSTLGHLVQEDFCILQKDGQEHVLTGAVLCFPSSWTLAEKLGKPLMRIHRPVAQYDDQMGARVQRLFDAIRPEQPLWRVNLLTYTDPSLFQPRPESAPKRTSANTEFLRSERQCLIKLPQTQAVVFSIHTAVVARDALTATQKQILAQTGQLA